MRIVAACLLLLAGLLSAGRLDAAGTIQFLAATTTVPEDAGAVLLSVQRLGDVNASSSVGFATRDGTAREGVKYAAASGTLSFASGETNRTVAVSILNDGIVGGTQEFQVVLSEPTGGAMLGACATTTVRVTDNDPGVQLEFSKYWVGEDEGGIKVTVQRGRDVDIGALTVDYTTSAGTALAGQDFGETRGTLTFSSGETARRITVPVHRNESSTADRQFSISLSNPSAGASIGTNRTATVTILDTTGTQPHRIAGVAVHPDGNISLRLEGGVHKRFKDYFDLYPLEVSTDLATWTPWTTLQRTIGVTNALIHSFPARRGADQMFFRTAAGPLITPYRQPTGPHAVGTISRLVTDLARRNRYGVSTNGSFTITIFYPAVAMAGKLPEAHLYPYEKDNTFRADPNWAMDRARSLVTPTFPDSPWATNDVPFPVILHSSGGAAGRTELFSTGPNLASHGYVVVVSDNSLTRISTFPDGSVRYGPLPYGDIATVFSRATFEDRLRDFHVLLERLAEWNDTDPILSGRLDLRRLGTMGFSYGGGAAAEFARLDSRVKAVVLREAYLQNADDLVRLGLKTPFLGMYNTDTNGDELGDTTLFNHKAAERAVWFVIRGSQHGHFSGHYWLLGGLPNGIEIARTIDDWTLWFLDKHVKGLDARMPALKDYPRVSGFKQK